MAFCLGWAGLEFAGGTPFRGIPFGALGVCCAHPFFVAFDPPEEDDSEDQP